MELYRCSGKIFGTSISVDQKGRKDLFGLYTKNLLTYLLVIDE